MDSLLGGTIIRMADPRWKELTKYSACDVADALLKLHVSGAGFLSGISPIPCTTALPQSHLPRTASLASTFLMLPKASGSFPGPATEPQDIPPSNVQPGTPFADYTEADTIVVISQPEGQTCAVVGGIMAARMKILGAQGIIVDGQVRDLVALNELEIPIWSRGTSIIGAGAETKFHARNVPVRIGNITVEPGDIVMVDPYERGTVVVPRGKLYDVLKMLPALVEADEKVERDVEEGVTVQEAFKRHRGK